MEKIFGCWVILKMLQRLLFHLIKPNLSPLAWMALPDLGIFCWVGNSSSLRGQGSQAALHLIPVVLRFMRSEPMVLFIFITLRSPKF